MAEAGRLADAYAGVVCDLDGVVRRGSAAVPHAVEQLVALTVPVVYATNNASLTPDDVAEQLTGLGLAVGPEAVVTSSQAGAAYVAGRFPAGSAVLAVGGPGVAAALTEAGLTAVREAAEGVVAVLQGYGPAVTALDLAEASYAVQAGATWVATNRDATLPTHRGVAPGNGALISAVATATGAQPSVSTGKPEAPIYALSVTRLDRAGEPVLAIGDRLDTDILGAMAAGLDSLWVLTGVDDLVSFAAAPGRPVPTYAARDLRALARPAPLVTEEDGRAWTCGAVRVEVDWSTGELRVSSDEPDDADDAADSDDSDDSDALVAAATAALVAGRDRSGADAARLGRVARDLAARLR